MGLNIGLYLRRSERTDTEVRSIGTEVRRIGMDFRPRRNKGGGLSHSPRQCIQGQDASDLVSTW
jgi:hypothetical protein